MFKKTQVKYESKVKESLFNHNPIRSRLQNCLVTLKARRFVSSDKELYSTLSLFTQVYKWVPTIYSWGVTVRWASIPSRGSGNTSRCLMLMKPG